MMRISAFNLVLFAVAIAIGIWKWLHGGSWDFLALFAVSVLGPNSALQFHRLRRRLRHQQDADDDSFAAGITTLNLHH